MEQAFPQALPGDGVLSTFTRPSFLFWPAAEVRTVSRGTRGECGPRVRGFCRAPAVQVHRDREPVDGPGVPERCAHVAGHGEPGGASAVPVQGLRGEARVRGECARLCQRRSTRSPRLPLGPRPGWRADADARHGAFAAAGARAAGRAGVARRPLCPATHPRGAFGSGGGPAEVVQAQRRGQ